MFFLPLHNYALAIACLKSMLDTFWVVMRQNLKSSRCMNISLRKSTHVHLSIFLSPKKVDFLSLCGLTTLTQRNELLTEKRRKRRRMMRERSLSPPAVRSKRKICSLSTPTASLTTRYSAEQMDSTPELEEKKDFLLMFNLSHVSPQQRRGNNLFSSCTQPNVTLRSCSGDSCWKNTCTFSDFLFAFKM